MADEHPDFLMSRLANHIVDESLALKEVERELRGMVADIAVHQRGLKKKEVASRCGVTEKSIENYLKDSRSNPKSPERELARILQDQALTLEEAYEKVLPIFSPWRDFTLDDAKRAIEKLLRTGEVKELPGRHYRASPRPAIRCPNTPEAYRDLVDQKARDLDCIIVAQKSVDESHLTPEKTQRFSRVVGDTNLVRIDFTVNLPPEDLPEFYEQLTRQIAKLTMRYEKKSGKSRIRLLIGMRSVITLLLLGLLICLPRGPKGMVWSDEDSWELDGQNPAAEEPAAGPDDSWELDYQDDRSNPDDERYGSGGDHSPLLDLPRVFIRGDANVDARVNIADAIVLVRYLFAQGPLPCADAADVNDDGWVEVLDPVQLLKTLYGTVNPAASGLIRGPQVDETQDGLGCDVGLPQ
ncbi:MAG: hypothetical protein HY717_01210 [Planctomycetes bacterium]|nr:hypothetical protein [Planctomycetota bacterium]